MEEIIHIQSLEKDHRLLRSTTMVEQIDGSVYHFTLSSQAKKILANNDSLSKLNVNGLLIPEKRNKATSSSLGQTINMNSTFKKASVSSQLGIMNKL